MKESKVHKNIGINHQEDVELNPPQVAPEEMYDHWIGESGY